MAQQLQLFQKTQVWFLESTPGGLQLSVTPPQEKKGAKEQIQEESILSPIFSL